MSADGSTLTLLRMGFREQRRRPLLLIMLVVIPVFFITRAVASTLPIPKRISLPGGGTVLSDMQALHGATMVTITVGFLAALCGVFVMESAKQADRRLVIAGVPATDVVGMRLALLVGTTLLVTAVSLLVTAPSFTPRSWPMFTLAVALIGITYAAAGAIGGALLGRLGATYLLVFTAMLDLGIVQSPMFGGETPARWAALLPGYGPMRVLIGAAFGSGFHAGGALVLSIAWALGLSVGATVVLRRSLGAEA